MKYYVHNGGAVVVVELSELDPAKITVDGVTHSLGGQKLNGRGEIGLLLDGKPLLGQVSGADGALRVQVDGVAFDLTVNDQRVETVRSLAGESSLKRAVAGEVKAPMPGLVVKLQVAPGESVRKGQGVVVVEAMKMENIIPAPIDGVVEKVSVAPGQVVEKGAVLAVVKAATLETKQ